jgi:maleate isomerase
MATTEQRQRGAGALVEALHALGARRTALLTPYARPLTRAVADYIEDCGVEVRDSVSLEVTENIAVGRLDPGNLIELARGLELGDVDAVVLSACVQMPSLPAIAEAERELGLPVLPAATATTRKILIALDLDPVVPHAGRALGPSASPVRAG